MAAVYTQRRLHQDPSRECIGIPLIRPTAAESIRRVVGPQFSDFFWPVACGLWDFFFFYAAGGTRVQAVIHIGLAEFSKLGDWGTAADREDTTYPLIYP
jgi:hypothetical protein